MKRTKSQTGILVRGVSIAEGGFPYADYVAAELMVVRVGGEKRLRTLVVDLSDAATSLGQFVNHALTWRMHEAGLIDE